MPLDYTYGVLAAPDDEAVRTHVHVYTLDPCESSAALLPYAFPPVTEGRAALDGVRASAFVLVLDWRTPWSFIADLKTYLDLGKDLVDSSTSAEADVDRAAMQASLTARTLAGMNTTSLPVGMLTDNLGVPLVIVLSHADVVPTLLEERRLTEHQCDFLQQTLRTVAMRYGAALVSTSSTQPASMDFVRDFVRHQFLATAWTPRASTNEVAALAVPPGWDTWGKIGVVDESFVCASMSEAWDSGTLAALYTAQIPAHAAQVRAHATVELPDEQAFLTDLLAKQQANGEAGVPTSSSGAPTNVLGPPSTSSTLDMPAVEQAMAAPQEPDAPATPLRPAPGKEAHAARAARGTATPKQSEVLQSFFQSRTLRLLTSPEKAGEPWARLCAKHAKYTRACI